MNLAVEKFRRLADHYCAVIEDAPRLERLELHETLLDVLPALYTAGSALPPVEPETEDDLPDRPTHEDWFGVLNGLQAVLGPSDYYRSVEPYPNDARDEPSLGSVADDLADIWRDLKHGLLALDGGCPEADVIFGWRFGFTSHWGRHAVDALAAMHKFYW